MEVIIFCGVQASGKTTFYKDHFFKTHVRISLDLLNTRNKELKFIQTCLLIQQRFVIDNTNTTILERSKYISLAKDYKFKVVCYFFQTTLNDSFRRNGYRAGKEFVPEIGIRGTFKKLEVPTFDEGYDEMFFVELIDDNFVIKGLKNEI